MPSHTLFGRWGCLFNFSFFLFFFLVIFLTRISFDQCYLIFLLLFLVQLQHPKEVSDFQRVSINIPTKFKVLQSPSHSTHVSIYFDRSDVRRKVTHMDFRGKYAQVRIIVRLHWGFIIFIIIVSSDCHLVNASCMSGSMATTFEKLLANL